MTSETSEARRAVVLGLDGIPWGLLDRWMRAGHLPNLAAVAADGVAGPLESTRPPSTPLAWPSIATGVWPDKHGLYDFYRLRSDYSRPMNTSATNEGLPLWEIAAPAVVGNVPMTYPADEIDGAMVSGMMAPELDDGFARPTELRDEIRERIPEYVVGLDWNDYRDDPDALVDDVTGMVEARRVLLRLLVERDWRLLFFVFTAPDRLQHLCWDESVLLEHYALLDDVVGEAREHAEAAGANLFVVSDHGFGPVDRYVNANDVLVESGHLVPKGETAARGALERAGVTKDAVVGAFDSLGVDLNALLKSLPSAVVDSVAERVPGDHGLYDVVYEETAAFIHGAGNVYVNDTGRFDRGAVDPADRPTVRAELRTRFQDVTDPETGERVFAVHDGTELFPADDRSPDLVLVPEPGYAVEKRLSAERFTDAPPQAGDHRVDGVFLAAGPDVVATGDAAGAGTGSGTGDGASAGDGVPTGSFAGGTVVDVAPTVLHGLGEAVPETADGSVLEIFDPASDPGRDPVETRAYDRTGHGGRDDGGHGGGDGDSDVEDRLRGLGYVE